MEITKFISHLGTDGQLMLVVYLTAMVGSLVLLTTERRAWHKVKGYQRREFAPIKPVQLTSKSFSHLED
jgi:hypothetical protein